MRHVICKYSHKNLVLVTSLFSVLLTQLMVHGGYYVFGIDVRMSEQVVSIIAPLSIAFVVTWFLFDLLKKLDSLEKEMRGLANNDHLSNTLTKKAFLELANDRMKIARREKQDISLLMMDLDHFKIVNDTYGHLAGDYVIKSVGQLLNRNKREADLAGRFGGDEFIMLLWGTDAAGAIQFASDLCVTVKRLELQHNGNIINLSTSIGLSGVYGGNHEEVTEIVSQADKALYLAKKSGRDKFVAFEQ